jgi:hypothetical protein
MVTRRLGMQATGAHEAGDPVGSRSEHTRGFSLWRLTSSPYIEAGTEIGEQLDRLLAILEPVTTPL